MPAIAMHKSTQLKSLPNTSTLSFGTTFTDHIFMCQYEKGKGWSQPNIQPYGTLQLDPACSAIHYGQSLFEGMKAYRHENNKIALFRPSYHFQRLANGARRLCMEAPPVELMQEGLKAVINVDERWVPHEEGCALYIRPTLFAVEPFLGVRPSNILMFVIILSPVSSYYGKNKDRLKIWVERKYVRAAPGGLGAIKASANYAASMSATEDAKARGYQQVLWTNAITHEYVEEVGTMNVFFRFKNTHAGVDEIVTPELDGTILNGCTRDCVLQLLREWNVPVAERKLGWTEILRRHQSGELLEVFGTGTAASISPIAELGYEGGTLQLPESMPLADRLRKELVGIHSGRISRPDWIEYI